MNTFPTFFIISAHRDTATTEENREATEALKRSLNSFELVYKPVVGCYKGKEELSFLVLASDYAADFDVVMELARRFGQESILEVDPDRIGHLIMTSGSEQRLGRWEKVTSIKGLDAYTIDVTSGDIYTCLV